MTKSILVVDDEEPILELICDRLKDSGYYVSAASDGIQAVNSAHMQKPDLILLDVKIPGGGGIGVFEKLKMSKNTASIPIIFITAYDNEDLRQKLFAKGAKDFIAKPFKFEELIRKVKQALGEDMSTGPSVP